MKEKDYLELLFPKGLLDYFEAKEISKTEETTYLHLEELNIKPERYKDDKLVSKGFYDEITVQDFPLRGNAFYLKIKRRKWFNESLGLNVCRDWDMVAKGTRMTEEFATFLKEFARYAPSKL